jgi:ABC-type multidrug transport system ATPase subunit
MTLTVANLTKSYVKGTKALDDFSYTFEPGVYGLFGPNGVGKSTLMNIITTNLKQTSGNILCNNTNIDKLGADYRAQIGYMPQQNGIYSTFTLLRFLRYMAELKDIKKPDDQIKTLVDRVNLSQNLHQKLGSFSGGMKQRALVSQAMLGDPKLLILDEPTAGLDPKERVRLREFIRSESHERIVIWATHVISDVESLAKDILFLKKGHLVTHGAPDSFGKGLEEVYMDIFGDENEK